MRPTGWRATKAICRAEQRRNFWAAREVRRRYPALKNVLTFLCDRGEKYLSLMYGAKAAPESDGS